MVKNLPANAGDTGSIPGSGKAHGEGNGNPIHCSYLRNPMDREAWQATVDRVTEESDMTQPLNSKHVVACSSVVLGPYHWLCLFRLSHWRAWNISKNFRIWLGISSI